MAVARIKKMTDDDNLREAIARLNDVQARINANNGVVTPEIEELVQQLTGPVPPPLPSWLNPDEWKQGIRYIKAIGKYQAFYVLDDFGNDVTPFFRLPKDDGIQQ